MTPPTQKCKDCGKITKSRTVGVPIGTCPERDAVYACHRYKVIDA